MYRRFTVPLVIAAGLCVLFLIPPVFPNTQKQIDRSPQPKQELAMKQQIMQRDVAMTDQLCREQCTAAIRRVLHDAGSNGKRYTASEMQRALDDLQKNHEHMVYLKWRPPSSSHAENIVRGNLPESIRANHAATLREAEQAAAQGKVYASDPIRIGKDTYFVLNVFSPDMGSITGVVRQHLLDQVHKESRKNLRIVPYPSDKRFKIESVDADTLKDVRVDHPEDNEGTSHYYIDHIVVKFRKPPGEAEMKQIREDIDGKVVKQLGLAYVFHSDNMSAKQMMDYFRKRWNPLYVEPHFIYLTNESDSAQNATEGYVPNDVLFDPYQWNLPNIETLEGWNVSRGAEEVVIAVIDTGVDLDHPDLAGRLATGMNFIHEDERPADDVGHGTHVTGIIAATVDNVEGIAGMSWFNKVLPVKVLDQTGAGSAYAVAQGIIWATDNGAKVINLSLGNYVASEFLHDAVKYAYDRDVVLVAATGNDNTSNPGYPAAYPEVIAVSATNSSDQKAAFSNYGDYVDVVAPGENIPSTYLGKQYAAMSGTSMASPHVAALAGMIRSLNPELTNVEVMELLRTTAVDLGTPGKDPYYGYGRIDVKKALESALNREQSIFLRPKKLERSLKQYEYDFL